MKTTKRAIVNYYELSEEWQEEARNNLDEFAEEALYLEPQEYDPNIVLWDLFEAMPNKGSYSSFQYNATIGISNNSVMLLNIDDNFESCEYVIG